MAASVRRISPAERSEGAGTAGIIREEAIATERTWAGLARTGPGTVSGWHHHGEYETVIYVLAGGLRMESGPGGEVVVDGGPGDFLYVAPHAVHREGNPTDQELQVVVVRTGSGEPVVNVDGPERR